MSTMISCPRPTALATALLLTACLTAGAAGAETKPSIAAGDFEVGFGLGGTRLDDQVADETDRRSELRAGYFLTDHLGLELTASRTEAPLDANLDLVFLNASWNFTPGEATVPYVLVGAGQARVSDIALFSRTRTETGLAWQAAVGSRFYFGDARRWAARVELSAAFDEALPDTSRHVGLTGGLLWRIGR